MNLSQRPKVILQNPQNGQYLSEVPDETNNLGCAIWSPHVDYAKQMSMPEVLALSEGWSFLNNCAVLPVPKGE